MLKELKKKIRSILFLVCSHEKLIYKLSLTTKRSNSLNVNNQSYLKKKKRKRKTINQKQKSLENKLSNKIKLLEQECYHLNPKKKPTTPRSHSHCQSNRQ